MLGGRNKGYEYTNSAYACSLSDLLQSASVLSQSQSVASQGEESTIYVWSQIADLPATQSTYEYFHGRLLAIGGEDAEGFTTGVYMYHSISDSWELVSRMTIG